MPTIGSDKSNGFDIKKSWLSWRRSLYDAIRSSGGWTLFVVGAIGAAKIEPITVAAKLIGGFFEESSFIAGESLQLLVPPETDHELWVRLSEMDPRWLGLLPAVVLFYVLVWRKV